MKSLLFSTIVLSLLTPCPVLADYSKRDDVKAFISKLSDKYGYNQATLMQWFSNATQQTTALESIARPAEGLPWYKYRKIFIKDKRVTDGVKFWKENRETLERAEQKYGVPPEIITAIIGVETFYGKHKGEYPVFDALVTLGFDYPKRGKFFRSELEQYLLLVREEELDAFTLKGSYAGAMGKPQFISSSYRHYAVDFDGDGKRDLLDNNVDVIGSVANYFKRHGWKRTGDIAIRATFKGDSFRRYAMKPTFTIDELSRQHILPTQPVRSSLTATPIALEFEQGHEYWLGLHNFYVITRYNHSNLYAMAVYQLSQQIKQAMM